MVEESDHRAAPVRSAVTATVKWFNPAKGFGFAQVAPDEPDIFVHASVMARAGISNLPNGSQIVCDVAEGERGLQVTAIHSLDTSTAVATPHQERPRAPGSGVPREGEREVIGTVKFYDVNKGYGFVIPDGGDQDVFVPGRILPKTGLTKLEPNQRVRLRCHEGDKGPLATWVETI